MHICENCGLEFKWKCALEKHQSKPTPCVLPIPDKVPNNMCKWCGRTLSNVSSCDRHLKTCVVRKNRNKLQRLRKAKDRKQKEITAKESDEKIDKLVEANERMQEQLAELMRKVDGGIVAKKEQPVQINNYISPYIVNGNIYINNIHEPNTDFITAKFVEELTDKHQAMAPLYLTLDTYFNPDRPENHSFHIVNAVTKDSIMRLQGSWQPMPPVSTRGHINIILQDGFGNTIKNLRIIEKYNGSDLFKKICNIRADDKLFAAYARQLMQMAIDAFKRNNITPDSIEKSIERGKLIANDGKLIANDKFIIENGKEEDE